MWFKKKTYTLEDLNKEIIKKVMKLSKKYNGKSKVSYCDAVLDYASFKFLSLIIEQIVNDSLRNDEFWGDIINSVDESLDLIKNGMI